MSQWTERYFSQVVDRCGRVAVLMGGNAAERDISLQSGQAIATALKSSGVDAVAVDWDGRLALETVDTEFDRYFIAVHGRGGEDGKVQAALELMGIPYTGSGVLGSALAMDKVRTKLVWQGAGLLTPSFRRVDDGTDIDNLISELGLPLAVKPAREGSSFGVVKVTEAGEIESAIATASAIDSSVIAEQWIEGAEYTMGILQDRALPMIRLEVAGEFYDFEAKYERDDTRYICPCGLASAVESAAAATALAAFQSLDAGGWGRIDFVADGEGNLYLIELNTVPGMTDHSLVPMAAGEAGLSFEQLCLAILATSMTDAELQ
ncbi:MAG: D-alanine--D-alanine ligase [Gammaproteobacteria bacterium]